MKIIFFASIATVCGGYGFYYGAWREMDQQKSGVYLPFIGIIHMPKRVINIKTRGIIEKSGFKGRLTIYTFAGKVQ